MTSAIFTENFVKDVAFLMIKSKHDNKWERFIKFSKPHIKKYAQTIVNIYAEQEKEIIENLPKYSKAPSFIDEEGIINWDEYRIMLTEFGKIELPLILAEWAIQELKLLEVDIAFDVVSDEVLEVILDRTNKFASNTITQTRKQLHKVIADSITNGDDIPTITRNIKSLYKNLKTFQAERIARSEVIWAQNEGAEWAYIQSNVVQEKEWWTARDERRCPYCASMHGKRIRLGETYFNLNDIVNIPGAKPMKIDYEPILHPPLHPNCRCTLVPIVEF